MYIIKLFKKSNTLIKYEFTHKYHNQVRRFTTRTNLSMLNILGWYSHEDPQESDINNLVYDIISYFMRIVLVACSTQLIFWRYN